MKLIRVLIVEDSRVVRLLLEHLIRADPRLELAGSVGSAEEALRVLEQVAPDVISMDIRLPGMNGFEATRRIMAERPTPIVVVSASVEAADLQISMNALRAGALAVVEKPVGTSHADYQAVAERLCTQLVIMSQVRVVRQRADRTIPARRPVPSTAPSGPFAVLGLVASTGGPRALSQVLGALAPTFPLPILVVQHITSSFLEGFASWLGTVCPFPVSLAHENEVPIPGRVYLPRADLHLRLEQGRLRLDHGEPVCIQRPSGTILFRSMAKSLGNGALGVLLTGMGEDGAEGLADIRAAGGYTIAEDASTAVVHGMPGAAVQRGAACEVIPLPDIAPRILELVAPTRR